MKQTMTIVGISAATFLVLTALQETAANFGFDWRAILPKRSAGTPEA